MPTRFILLLVVIWLTACTPRSVQAPVSALPLETEEPSSSFTPVPTDLPPALTQQKMTEMAILDLSSRLSINLETIHVISTKSAVWTDAALGCPLPGKVYAPGAVPGFQIRLEAGGLEYFYNTDQLDQVILCQKGNPDAPNEPSFPVTPGDIQDGEPWMPVN